MIKTLDDIQLCTAIMCDKGYVMTDQVSENGKFILKKCPECDGRGFHKKEDVVDGSSD